MLNIISSIICKYIQAHFFIQNGTPEEFFKSHSKVKKKKKGIFFTLENENHQKQKNQSQKL